MSHEAQTSFYFLSLMCVKHARVRMCFVYFWTARTQVLSASFGVIFWGTHFTLMKGLFPKRLTILHWNLALETYIFSTYNFIRVPRSKNLFCNILARSGFRDFALFLVFWRCSWFFGGCSRFSGVVPGFLGVFRVFWGCSGFLGVPGCSGVPGSTTYHSQQLYGAICCKFRTLQREIV